MRLPDPQRSYAVLIGASTYSSQELADLPAVANNLTALDEALTDPALGCLPPERCVVLPDPTEVKIAYRTLRQHAALATDTLLVYFTGHGLLGGLHQNELYLALADTHRDELPVSALSFELIRNVFLESPAVNRVLILDCCFSGRASMPHMSDPEETAFGQIDIEGTYTLTAAPANSIALAPAGVPHTAFTGELLTLLQTGVSGGPELLTFAAIYRHLLRTLTSRGLPRPQQRNTGTADNLALTRNPAHSSNNDRKEPRPQRPPRAARSGLSLVTTGSTIIRTKKVDALAFSPDGRNLAVATATNTVRIFDTANFSLRLAVRQHWRTASIFTVAFSPSGHIFAAGGSVAGGGMVQLRNARTGSRRRKLVHDAEVWAVAFNPEGRWLATGDHNGNVQIWDTDTGEPVIGVTHLKRVHGVAFSPDSRRLATGSIDGIVRIWDPYTGEQKTILTLDCGVYAVAFSPDGRLLATASTPPVIWDAYTGTKLLTLSPGPALGDLCHDIAFNPDGRLLAAAYLDHTARIWDTHTGAELLKLIHDHEVHAVAFSPDGRLLATGDGGWQAPGRSGPGTIHVWQLKET